MPSLPFFLAIVAAVLIARLITAILYEAGKAAMALWLAPGGQVDIIFGGIRHGKPPFNFKVGRLVIFLRFSPEIFIVNWTGYHGRVASYGHRYAIHLGGVLAVLGSMLCLALILPVFMHPLYVRIGFMLYSFAAIIGLWLNFFPPHLLGGSIWYNDYFWLRNFLKQHASEKRFGPIAEKFQNGNTEDALSDIATLERKGRLDKATSTQLAHLYIHAGYRDKALDVLRAFEKQIQKRFDSLWQLAVHFGYLEAYDDCLRCLERARMLKPHHHRILLDYGFAHLMNGTPGQTIAVYEGLLQHPSLSYSDQAYVEANLGLAKIYTGDEADGFALIEQAIRTDSHCAYAYRNLGLYWLERGRPAEARAMLEKAKKLDPDTHLVDRLLTRSMVDVESSK